MGGKYSRGPGRFAPSYCLSLRALLRGSVFLGPLGLCNILLTFLLFLLLFVPGFNHLGQFPRQQRTGNEEGCESQYDRREETVGVFGSPLHHVLRPASHVDHGQQFSAPVSGGYKRLSLINTGKHIKHHSYGRRSRTRKTRGRSI